MNRAPQRQLDQRPEFLYGSPIEAASTPSAVRSGAIAKGEPLILPCETRSSKEGIRPGPIVVVTVRWSASFLRG
jgi:hypothetical protein